MADSTQQADDLIDAVVEAREAANGDSNDAEITALQHALDLALEYVPADITSRIPEIDG